MTGPVATTKTQCESILRWLREGNSITAREALERFGSSRLAARIGDLRKAGHQIESRMIKTDTGKRIAKYKLVRESTDQTGSVEESSTACALGQGALFGGRINRDAQRERRFVL